MLTWGAFIGRNTVCKKNVSCFGNKRGGESIDTKQATGSVTVQKQPYSAIRNFFFFLLQGLARAV